MRYFLKIENGKIISHAIAEENLLQVYPEIDLENLKNNYVEVELTQPPGLSFYEIYEGVNYEKIGDKYKSVHLKRTMTDEEKVKKQEQIKQAWIANNNPLSWIFNKESGDFSSPVPYPNDGKTYRWDEPTTSWILVE